MQRYFEEAKQQPQIVSEIRRQSGEMWLGRLLWFLLLSRWHAHAFTALSAPGRATLQQLAARIISHPVRGVLFGLEEAMSNDNAIHQQASQYALAALASLSKLTIPKKGGLTNKNHDPLALLQALNPTAATDELKLFHRIKEQKYKELYSQLQPLKGLRPFVRFLHRQSIPIALVATSDNTSALHTLQALGLLDMAARLVVPDACDAGKHNAPSYQKGVRMLGLHDDEAKHCLAFEGSLVGVESAARVGIPVVGITTSHSEVELCAAGAMFAVKHFEQSLLWEYIGCRIEVHEGNEIEWEDTGESCDEKYDNNDEDTSESDNSSGDSCSHLSSGKTRI